MRRNKMIQSPLNYTGGKYKLLPQILPLFPKDINCFVDLFCGGCKSELMFAAKKYVYNDSCEPLINLYSVMQTLDSASFIEKIETVIKRYGLSDVNYMGMISITVIVQMDWGYIIGINT